MNTKTVLILLGVLVCITMSYNGNYQRSDQTCTENQSPGLFWDGQKCEQCINQFCQCSAYLGCDSCVSGYSLYSITQDITDENKQYNNVKCYKCPNNASDCCFQGVTNDYVTPLFPNSIEGQAQVNAFLISRALRCYSGAKQPPTGEQIIGNTREFGAYCLYIPGCITYTNYGECFECADGYYFGSQTYDSVDSQGYKNSVCTKCEPANCLLCSSTQQCDTCAPHYFMQITAGRQVYPADKPGASVCTECADNCLCSGNLDTNGNPLLCDLGCSSSNFIFQKPVADDPVQNTCTLQCDTNCLECKEDPANSTATICTKCSENSNFPAVLTSLTANLNSLNQCLPCPDFCSQCEIVKDTPSCLPQSCFNGYYRIVDKNGVATCGNCDSNDYSSRYILRCNGLTDITQCGIEGSNEQTIEFNEIIAPHNGVNDPSRYVLIYAGTPQSQCLTNDKNCKTLEPVQADNGYELEAKCTACYEDLGYILAYGKCILCQDEMVGCNPGKCTQQTDNIVECNQCSKNQSTKYGDFATTSFVLVSGTCLQCAKHCYNCDTSKQGNCDTCVGGFYLDLTKVDVCQQCGVDQCRECSGQYQCTQCYPGFSLWNKVLAEGEAASNGDTLCLSCPSNCLTCGQEKQSSVGINISDRKKCTKCNSSHYLDTVTGVCHPARAQCLSYDTQGNCNHCTANYRIVSGYCQIAVAPSQGYINVQYGCSSEHRIRDDGNWLNREQFSDWVYPINANILTISLALLSVLIIFV